MTVETEVAALTTAVNSLTSTVNVSKATLDASVAAAEAAETAAVAAETAAEAVYDSFDDRYLGVKSSAPSTDNDGGALLTGALYFNSTNNTMNVFTGSAWAPVANNNIINPNVALTQDLATNGNDVKFGDSDKATFGASDDLQIYHDGSHSRIADRGTGDLRLYGDSLQLNSWTSTNNYLTATTDAAVAIYHAGSPKLATTATGIDVTGKVSSDGLEVDLSSSGNVELTGAANSNAGLVVRDPTATAYGAHFSYDDANTVVSIGGQTNGTKNTAISIGRDTNDISFYDTAGSSQALFWDASETSLGIGTTSPASTLEIAKNDQTNGATLSITNSFEGGDWNLGDTIGTVDFRVDDSSTPQKVRGQIKVFDDASAGSTYPFANAMSFSTGYLGTLNERMRITSDGEIRTSNAVIVGRLVDRQAQTVGVTDATIVLAGNSSTSGAGEEIGKVAFYNQDSSGFGQNLAATIKALTSTAIGAKADLVFSTKQGAEEGAEALETMRISSNGSCRWTPDGTNPDMTLTEDGNLLVGKASTSSTTVGAEIRPEGRIFGTTDNQFALLLNRTSTDGDIAVFRKDSTTVGSIGTGGGDVVVASRNNKGFKIYAPNADGTGAILHPSTDSSGNPLDAKMDLGYSSGRFKDLYLSGGVYLGGTGAANKLDDYEEGTWTPAYTATSGSVTMGVVSGSYTKVGNLVTLYGKIEGKKNTASGTITITGLPFASVNDSGTMSIGLKQNFLVDRPDLVGRTFSNSISLRANPSNATGQYSLSANDLRNVATTDNTLTFTVTYKTDS